MRTFALLLMICISWMAYSQEVVELPQPASGKIIVRLQFQAGSICDPAGQEGLTAFTANWIDEGGTISMTKSDIDDFIYKMAASYGVSVDKEVTTFTFQFPTDYAEEFYPILRDLILQPAFAEGDYSRVMARQQNYVTRSVKNSSDEDYSKLVLEQYLFAGSNMGHMVAGTAAGLSAITPEAAQQQYERCFTKDNLLIGLAGNYSAAFKDRLVKDMQRLPALSQPLPQAGTANQPEGMQVKIVAKPGAFGSAICMGYPLSITRADEDFAALLVANSFLGEHRKSYGKLYQKIRETRSMNYGDYSYIEWYPAGSSNQLPLSGFPRSSNYASIWIRPVQIGSGLRAQAPELADVEVGHAPFAIRMALREMQMLAEQGMSPIEFELTRTFLRSYIKLYIKSPLQRLGYLMDSRFYGREDWINEVDAQLATLTVDDVNAAAKKYWQTQNIFISIITSPDEATVLADYFRTGKPSPMSYTNVVKEGLNEAVYAEDKEVESYPLQAAGVEVINTADLFLK